MYAIRSVTRSFGGQILLPAMPRIVLVLAVFAQPLLIADLIDWASTSHAPRNRGWAIVGAFVCIYATIVIATSVYWQQVDVSRLCVLGLSAETTRSAIPGHSQIQRCSRGRNLPEEFAPRFTRKSPTWDWNW